MAYAYGNIYGQPGYYAPQWQQVYQNPQPQPQPQQQPQQNGSGFIWVQGEAGAKAYPVGAGNSVLLMDSENPVLYVKSTDVNGRPLPMETFDLVKREVISSRSSQQQPAVDIEATVQNIVNKVFEQYKQQDLEPYISDIVGKILVREKLKV